mmetsp:Transcript_49067/g.115291  ORF Transcript_49067/g.115291 Transcript_49067/m.115291 type:complete len:512 (-) Transcript_49067:32-1567(-)
MTMAAALSVQSPLVRLDEGSPAMSARRELYSEEGDAFTLVNVFDMWIQIKAGRRENSRGWCRRHGIEEQRLYEMSRLKDQFRGLLQDAGLLRRKGEDVGDFRTRDGDRKYKRRQLKKLNDERERSRKRRVLSMEGQGTTSVQGEEGDSEQEDTTADQIDLKALDFELTYDLNKLSRACRRDLTQGDVDVIKLILCAGLYPRFAIPDPINPTIQPSEAVFHTQYRPSVSMHPTSVFWSQPGLVLPHQLLAYGSILHTHKAFLTYAVRVPAMHALLLLAESVDTTPDCSLALVDDWLMLDLGEVGERIIAAAGHLRLFLDKVMSSRLHAANDKLLGGSSSVTDPTPTSTETRPLPPLLAKVRSAIAAAAKAAEGGEEPDELAEVALGDKLGEFLSTGVVVAPTRPPRNEVLWRLLHPRDGQQRKIAALRKAAARISELRGSDDDDQPRVSLEKDKQGVPVSDWLRWGSLFDGDMAIAGFADHMQRPYVCPVCGQRFLATLTELLEHRTQCGDT